MPRMRIGNIAITAPPTAATAIVPSTPPVAHVNVVVLPVHAVIEPRAHGITRAERDERISLRVVPVINANRIGIRRFDVNVGIIHNHLLLRGVHEMSRGLRLRAKLLDGVHHICGLGKKCVANLRGPFKVLIQILQDIRVMSKRFDTVVPCLVWDLRGIAIPALIALRKHDVGGHRRCRQDQCDQRIRVERERAEQLIQLI